MPFDRQREGGGGEEEEEEEKEKNNKNSASNGNNIYNCASNNNIEEVEENDTPIQRYFERCLSTGQVKPLENTNRLELKSCRILLLT